MAENEEIKPIRKTWTMLKKAHRPIYFDTNIFPLMNAYCQVDTKTAIIQDTRGLWKVDTDTPYSYNGNVWPVWKTLDNSTTSECEVMYYNTSFKESTVTYTLPEGVQICPHNMAVTVRMMSSGSVEGYNPLTESWEKIISISKTYLNAATYTYTDTTNEVYYNAFRVRSKQYDSGNRVMYLYELKCTEGYILPNVKPTEHFEYTDFNYSILPQFADMTIDGSNKLAGEAPYGIWTLTHSVSGGTFTDPLNIFDKNIETYCIYTNKGKRDATAVFDITLPKGLFMSIKAANVAVELGSGSSANKHKIYVQGYNYGTGTWQTLTDSFYFTSDTSSREFTVNTTAANYYNKFRLCIFDPHTTTLAHDVNIYDFQITAGTLKYCPELA